MKKSLLLIPATFLLTSCVNSSFSGTRRGAISSYYSGHIESKYEYCDGSGIFEFEVKKDQALIIKCEITTKSGEINFSVSPKGQNSIFAKSTTEDNKYDVELPDYGKYKITINMNSHSGSYLFDWTK
ncbi:MAG: hypothetical protein MJ190_00540 [Bacilli bacterium]|nr:hypothetical protein [Bacilli bacterium]